MSNITEGLNGKTLGEWLHPSLLQIEDTIWSFEMFAENIPPQYTNEGFRAIMRLFMSAMMDKIWALQEAEGMEMEDRAAMVEKCGQEVRALVKTFTNIDTQKLYEL